LRVLTVLFDPPLEQVGRAANGVRDKGAVRTRVTFEIIELSDKTSVEWPSPRR
jgi:hypothetical protein